MILLLFYEFVIIILYLIPLLLGGEIRFSKRFPSESRLPFCNYCGMLMETQFHCAENTCDVYTAYHSRWHCWIVSAELSEDCLKYSTWKELPPINVAASAPSAHAICEQRQAKRRTLKTLHVLDDLLAYNTYLNQVRDNLVQFIFKSDSGSSIVVWWFFLLTGTTFL